jgi:hypothetical protein
MHSLSAAVDTGSLAARRVARQIVGQKGRSWGQLISAAPKFFQDFLYEALLLLADPDTMSPSISMM